MSVFRGKLVKMIRNADSKYDDLLRLKLDKILLHWGCELTENDFLNELRN